MRTKADCEELQKHLMKWYDIWDGRWNSIEINVKYACGKNSPNLTYEIMDSEPTTTAGEWNPGFTMDSTMEMSAQCYQQAEEKRTADQMLRIIGGKGSREHGQHGWGQLLGGIFHYWHKDPLNQTGAMSNTNKQRWFLYLTREAVDVTSLHWLKARED